MKHLLVLPEEVERFLSRRTGVPAADIVGLAPAMSTAAAADYLNTTETAVIDLMRSRAAITTLLNRNTLKTGNGNRWTRERVTSLRAYNGISVYRPETRQADGWMNFTEAARIHDVLDEVPTSRYRTFISCNG
jgi:hypothetical protein